MRLYFTELLSLVIFILVTQFAGAAIATNVKWVNALKPQGIPAKALKLATDGKTDYVILLPLKPTSQEDKAAADLAMWLKEMTGAEFPIIKETNKAQCPAQIISIGRTRAAFTSGLSDSNLGREGYKIVVRGDQLFLLGGTVRGPINAVYALLEEDLGCRWYTRDSATIPHIPNLVVRPVPRRFVPTLEIRDPFYWDSFDGTWSLRNRTNAAVGFKN